MFKTIKYSSDNFFEELEEILNVDFVSKPEVVSSVRQIIENVSSKKNSALFEYTKQFDNFDVNENNIRVTTEEVDAALANADKNLIEALETAYTRVHAYHERQIPINEKYQDNDGFSLGWKWNPLESVGLYVPGGKAFYPSSVIMNAVPALVAGVKRIAITVPAPNGVLNPTVLMATRICGINEIYKVGGAQAVAALAYGTETIEPVAKIVGPGNAYVAEAKRQVFGKVGIDMIAGPSEILVITDSNSNPRWIAADLLSQAEHDGDARIFLIADSEIFVKKVMQEIESLLERLERKDIALQAIKNNGLAIIVNDIEDDAAFVANKIAAEHLEICTKNPEAISKKITNAGAIFLGSYTPEAIGDYIAGPSHVLPTMGSAKFSSGLSVLDFMKRTSMIKASQKSYDAIGEKTIRIAREEKLTAHALSVKLRME
jgi:histidinol dehydrogenase